MKSGKSGSLIRIFTPCSRSGDEAMESWAATAEDHFPSGSVLEYSRRRASHTAQTEVQSRKGKLKSARTSLPHQVPDAGTQTPQQQGQNQIKTIQKFDTAGKETTEEAKKTTIICEINIWDLIWIICVFFFVWLHIFFSSLTISNGVILLVHLNWLIKFIGIRWITQQIKIYVNIYTFWRKRNKQSHC